MFLLYMIWFSVTRIGLWYCYIELYHEQGMDRPLLSGLYTLALTLPGPGEAAVALLGLAFLKRFYLPRWYYYKCPRCQVLSCKPTSNLLLICGIENCPEVIQLDWKKSKEIAIYFDKKE